MRKARALGVIMIFAAIIALFSLCAFFSANTLSNDRSYAYSTSDGVYEIRSSEDFSALLSFAKDEAYDFAGKTVNLYADVTLPTVSDTAYFADFNGTFHGNGFSISGMNKTFVSRMGASGKADGLIFTSFSINGAPVFANSNSGTLSDTFFYGTGGRIANLNYGTIKNVFFSATDGFSSSVFASVNGGSIENCYVEGDFAIAPEEADAALALGLFVQNSSSSGRLESCMLTGSVTVTGSREVNVYPFGMGGNKNFNAALLTLTGDDVSISATGTIANSYVLSGGVKTVFDDTGAQSSDWNDLTDGFYRLTDGYPFTKTLFDGKSGATGDEFVLYDIVDLKKLAFCQSETGADGFKAKFGNNIFNDGSSVREGNEGRVIGTVTGNGYVLSGTNAFGNTSGVNSVAVSVVSGFGDAEKQGSPSTVASREPKGSGTTESPYLITSAEELYDVLSDGNKNADGKYAVLTQDIIVNTVSDDGDRSLGFFDLKLHLDGLNHTIANLLFHVFETVEGTVEDVTVFFVSSPPAEYALCEEIALTGVVRGVTIKSGSGVSVRYPVCQTNRGTIESSVNECADAVFGICGTNLGTVTNCSSVETSALASDLTGFDRCTRKGYRVVSGEEKEGATYAELSEDGFDLTAVFGYKVGGSEDEPTIRRKGGVYRVLATEAVDVLSVSDVGYDVLPYDENGYEKEDIQDAILFVKDDEAAISTEISWAYEGENHTDASLFDVGEYTVKVRLYGSAYITVTREQTIVVEKSTFASGIVFEQGTFVSESFVYTGETIVSEITPINYADLIAAGFTVTYFATKNGAVAPLLTSGTYVQTIKATSKNYFDLSRSRNITVTKRTLPVTVRDHEVFYGETVDFSSFTEDACVSFPVGKDEGKTLKDLVSESGLIYTDYFQTTYDGTGDAGEYVLSYTLAETDDYIPEVTNGTLTVKPTEITGYVFEDGVFTYDKTAKSLVITSLPTGSEIVYENNDKTAAGEYTVKATVTHKNHLPLTAYASLTIGKATITLKASSANEPYGYEFDENDFGFEYTGVMTGDTFEEIVENVTITPYIDETGELRTGNYAVKLNVSGEAENYVFLTENGTLSVGKGSLYDLYPRGLYTDYSMEYTGVNAEYALPGDAFGDETTEIVYEIKKQNTVVNEIISVGRYSVKATVTPTGESANDYDEATYTRNIEITLIRTSISFERSVYEFTYSGEDFIGEEYAYETEKIPDGAEIEVYFTYNGNRVTEIVHAGTYTAVAAYVGDGNFADARTTASVVVKRRVARLTVGREYVYSGTRITPALEISYDDGFEGTLTISDIAVRYVDKYSSSLTYALAAGEYVLRAESANGDYTLYESEFPIEIKKFAFTLPLRALAFEYGTTGDAVYNGQAFTVTGGTVTARDIFVEQTGEYVTVSFLLKEGATGFYPIGEYRVQNAFVQQQNNYDITVRDDFVVTVRRRTLTVRWYDQGREISGSYAVKYIGESQDERFSYALEGFASGESIGESAINLSVRQGTATATVYYTGTYTLSLDLINTPNYVLDNATKSLSVVVEKANVLAVIIEDGTVMQREALPALAVRVEGLLGNDVGRAASALRGYRATINTDYSPSTAVLGASYNVTANFSFSDYYVPDGVTNTAKFKVVEGYPTYRLYPRTYVYDGLPKRLSVQDVEQGTTVEYTGNDQVNVGTYTVSALITYPTGRTTSVSGSLTITKATPTIVCEDEFGVYTGAYDLTPAMLNATATFNDVIPTVNGTFGISSGGSIRQGNNTVSVTFVPDDKRNFNSVSFTKRIVKYNVTENDLVWTGKYDADEEGRILFETTLSVTLNKTPYPEIADRLAMYRNGAFVTSVTFTATAKETIDVRFDGTVVFSATFDLVNGKNTPEDPDKPTIRVDESMLVTEGISFSADGKILMEGASGTIRLDDKYKDDFTLIVSGTTVTGVYTLYKTALTATIVILENEHDLGLFSKTYEISEPSKEPEIKDDTEKKSGFQTYYYYIIAGAAAVAITLVVVLVVKLRR